MSDMKILSQLFKETALVKPQKKNDKLSVKLSEPQSPGSIATIHNLPWDAIIIKGDKFRSPDSVFNGKRGECKRADFVIISEEKKCIIYIEMKRTKGGREKIVKQLMGAQCFVKYCTEIGKTFWKKNNFLRNYQSRFISIGRTGISKRGTRYSSKETLHDLPDQAMKINSPHSLQFNQIARLNPKLR